MQTAGRFWGQPEITPGCHYRGMNRALKCPLITSMLQTMAAPAFCDSPDEYSD